MIVKLRPGMVTLHPFVDYVDVWRHAGADIIGGCCRTTPEIIRDIARKIHKQ